MIGKINQWATGLKREVHALSIAYRDDRTPWYAKAFTAVVIAYAFSPIDLIPDFIPIIGYLDDLILVPFGIALALKMIPAQVMEESREKAKSNIQSGRPANWAGAAVIVLIWLSMAYVGLRWLSQLFRE